MARATSSLPTPLSPVIEDVVLKSAIFVMVRKMSGISALFARIDSNWFSLWICSLSARFSRRSDSRSSAFAQREHDLVGLERLADVVVGAGLHRLEREIDVAVRAHHDDRGRVLLGLERGEQIEAAHLRHAHVGEDDVGAERVDSASAASPLSATSTS